MLSATRTPIEMVKSAVDNSDCVDHLRTQLLAFARTYPAVVTTIHAVLCELSDELLSIREMGLSCEEICAVLNRCGVCVTTDDLQRFFEQFLVQRLRSCEQELADYRTRPWHAGQTRVAFIEEGLRGALTSGKGLILHYQPQVDSGSGRVIGAEALVRWQVDGVLLQPSEFIPVAEGSDLIVALGEWVLREACREAKRWDAMGLGGTQGIKVGVNLSVKQFTRGLTDLVHSILCDSGLPTKLLGLEVTESSIVRVEALDVLTTLSRSGMHLSIDDFGTGYSSLSQLMHMPLNTVKIDQSFVHSLGKGPLPSMVLGTIIELAHKLRMDTLAEGVETFAQAQILQQLGCSICQGFFYSEPLESNDFIGYVQEVN